MPSDYSHPTESESPSRLSEAQSPPRSPSMRREPRLNRNNLRTLYHSEGIAFDGFMGVGSEGSLEPATPVLPPTPPHVEGEQQDDELSSTDTTKMRSVLVTPVNQLSPPTPDLTPPREHRAGPSLGARPSMASTYAESFRTAQEDISSAAGSNASLPVLSKGHIYHHLSPSLHQFHANEHKPSPLSQTHLVQEETENRRGMAANVEPEKDTKAEQKDVGGSFDGVLEAPSVLTRDAIFEASQGHVVPSQDNRDSPTLPSTNGTRREVSLRQRLEESQNLPRTSSVDKFANIIGWNETVHTGDRRRLSGLSASTVEAIVFESPRPARKRGTLRHVSKHDSLRSASSPLPPPSHDFGQPKSESPYRLTHKKAKLSDRNRESFGSSHSRSFSLGSSLPPPRMEIIKVAVIPERISSLQGSATGSTREHSRSGSMGPVPHRSRRASDGQYSGGPNERTFSDTSDRGRSRYYPPQVGPYVVPPRASSLSAPTSRDTSRANSLTSDSLRSARKQAEKDLRSTLNKMESERIASSLSSVPRHTPRVITPEGNRVTSVPTNVVSYDFATPAPVHMSPFTPGTAEWAALRPPSLLATPFSAPSFLSASPEINEARRISLYPHNNHSIQLIEPYPLPESHAVMVVRERGPHPFRQDSPFRDPRAAPNPPTGVTFSSDGVVPEARYQSQHGNPGLLAAQQHHAPGERLGNTESFTRNLLRTVSLKHARNRKVDQHLDTASHPMWRPHAFWSDPDAKKRGQEQSRGVDGVVQNSVGIPQQRNGLTGPVGLMHRISNRRRNKQQIARQSSYNSLHRLRAGRKLYRIPGLGIHLQVKGLREIQERLAKNRTRREEGRRDKRREEISKTIGPPVISTSDPRFLVALPPITDGRAQ